MPRGEVGSDPYLSPQGGHLGCVGAPKDEGSHRPCPPPCSDILGTGWAEGTLVAFSPLEGQEEPHIPSPGMVATLIWVLASLCTFWNIIWLRMEGEPSSLLGRDAKQESGPTESYQMGPPRWGSPIGQHQGKAGLRPPSPPQQNLASHKQDSGSDTHSCAVEHPQTLQSVCPSRAGSWAALCSTFPRLVSYRPQPLGGGDQRPQNPATPMAPTPAGGTRGSPKPRHWGCEVQLTLPERGLGF